MDVPRCHPVEGEAETRRIVDDVRSALLVSTGPDRYPLTTLPPNLWRDDTVVAALNVAIGEVTAQVRKRHTAADVLAFVKLIDKQVPRSLDSRWS